MESLKNLRADTSLPVKKKQASEKYTIPKSPPKPRRTKNAPTPKQAIESNSKPDQTDDDRLDLYLQVLDYRRKFKEELKDYPTNRRITPDSSYDQLYVEREKISDFLSGSQVESFLGTLLKTAANLVDEYHKKKPFSSVIQMDLRGFGQAVAHGVNGHDIFVDDDGKPYFWRELAELSIIHRKQLRQGPLMRLASKMAHVMLTVHAMNTKAASMPSTDEIKIEDDDL